MSATPTETPAGENQRERVPTREYVVLTEGVGGTWNIHKTVVAATALSAIRKTTDAEGTYVAVPKRNWQPVRATIKTERRITLAENA